MNTPQVMRAMSVYRDDVSICVQTLWSLKLSPGFVCPVIEGLPIEYQNRKISSICCLRLNLENNNNNKNLQFELC
jgi:hypothetical protein